MRARSSGSRSAAVLAVVSAGLVVACSAPPSRLPIVEPRPAPTVIRGHDPEVSAARGPTPPAEGAWLGAWAKPAAYGPDGRAQAFRAFETQVGAELQIVHNYREWTDTFPALQESAMLDEADLLLLSWAGTDTRSIVTGSYDAVIRQRAEAIRDLGRPVLLRFRWEMDRPNLRTIVRDPEDFVAAWRHTRQIFTEVGALNAAWVWCPHVLGFVDPTRDARAYYPGDDEVDWLCADVYSEPSAGEALVPFGDLMDSFLEFAQLRTKPIIVAEYGVRSVAAPADRARWLRDAHAYVRAHPQVKALVYFSSSQVDRPGLDTTVTDPETLAAFRELAADPYFQVPVPPNEGS